MLLIIWRESALGIILFLARLLSLDEIADRGGASSTAPPGGSGRGT